MMVDGRRRLGTVLRSKGMAKSDWEPSGPVLKGGFLLLLKSDWEPSGPVLKGGFEWKRLDLIGYRLHGFGM